MEAQDCTKSQRQQAELDFSLKYQLPSRQARVPLNVSIGTDNHPPFYRYLSRFHKRKYQSVAAPLEYYRDFRSCANDKLLKPKAHITRI